jgi:hypothetical protein
MKDKQSFTNKLFIVGLIFSAILIISINIIVNFF